MADSKNSKISQLDELVNPLDGDFLPIVDTAGQETKKISYSSLIAALNADDDSYSIGQTDTLLAVNAAAIVAEESRATAAEVANAIDIDTNATDIATNAAAISTETTRATTAEGQLNTAIAAEITRAETAEGQLNTAIAAEITRAETAEEANATAISTETTRAQNAEQLNALDIETVAQNWIAEVARASAAEQANATNIATNATAISTETTRATAAEALLAPIDDATFTGTTTIPSADITTANFNAGATNGGELSWNGQERTLNLVTGTDTTIQVGQELVLYATNDSGVTIPNGSVVSIDGSQGNKPTIVLAQADTVANARKTIGITTESISDNSSGFVTLNGKVRDLVLDGGTYTQGEVVYLSSTVAGGITNIQPDISVELGHVLATSTGGNTGGVIEVQVNNESAVHELEQQVPHNSYSVVICNDGDNIQDKYDEAVALATGGASGYADLIVMSGIYSGITGTGNNYVSIIGVGNRDQIEIGGITLDQNYGLITNVRSNILITSNYADIKGVNSGSFVDVLENYGDIIDCSTPTFLPNVENYGLIEGCKSTGTARSFGGFGGSPNRGTIKNCTASGARSFGEQKATGLTENCTAVLQGFGATSSQITSGGGNGTYKNCTGGVGSFFGVNTDTTGTRVMLANYIDCTAQQQSFGYCNTSGATTVFSGTAKNCTAGFRSFAGANAGNAQISTGAIIENCSAGNFSFASDSPNTTNSGIILRCRTTSLSANAFRVDGATGKVRLCFDGNYNEVNLG